MMFGSKMKNDARLVAAVAELADRFVGERTSTWSVKHLGRVDLDLICFERMIDRFLSASKESTTLLNDVVPFASRVRS
jgi:hypothetical protein